MKYILLVLIILPSLALAKGVFKWVDENGKTHYGDSKPKNLNTKTVDLKLNTYESVSVQESNTNTDQVVMYSTSWCGYCKKARKYFKANNIKFSEYDIEKDRSAKIEYQKLGATGVPVILFKDRRMNGFSAANFRRLYESGA